MPVSGDSAAAEGGAGTSTVALDDIEAHLPLRLLRTQLVPPAPNRAAAAVDWLHDFGGASWVAYGAGSLLAISHFPSPLNPQESVVGPFFQQVIDSPPSPPAGDAEADVNAVRWCPARPSEGEVAVAVGNWVWFYSPAAENDSDSFYWGETTGIEQSFTVEAIDWTGSGDGLVTAGIEVVLWIRKDMSWQLAWKSRANVPQTIVSATWFAEGHIATAANLSFPFDGAIDNELSHDATEFSHVHGKESSCVSVYLSDGKFGITKAYLSHPLPVSMIQWRPSTGIRLKKGSLSSWREVLLTCCSDGAIRLWSEIDNGRGRKSSKDVHDQTRRSFHVIAVIEINQCLKGSLGMDIFIAWEMEFNGATSYGFVDNPCLSSEGSELDCIGKCEWLVAVGPKSLLTFWAIHCLDNLSPLRFPRVNLWKKYDLTDFKEYSLCNSTILNLKDRPIFVKAVTSRNWVFGPPIQCSLLQLLPDNSVAWLHLSSPSSTLCSVDSKCLEQAKEKCLSCLASGVLNLDGHSGNILQLAFHPNCEIELAVSLDSDNSLIFWSLSTIFNCSFSIKMLIHPAWKLLGKVTLSRDVKYSSLRWVPSILNEKQFLLLGHTSGIDCFLINISDQECNVFCHKILTIPFPGSHFEGPPDQIFITALASTSAKSCLHNSFLLFGVWKKKFHVLSWHVLLHSPGASEKNCPCNYDADSVAILNEVSFISPFEEKHYSFTALEHSSNIGDQNFDQVTCVAVLSPDSFLVPVQKYMAAYQDSGNKLPYNIATGYSNGTLKLWKISHAETTTHSAPQFISWELVGMFTAHQGPVHAVSLSNCGAKIASVSMNGQNSISSLHIWEPICFTAGGSFLLEDVVSLNWAVVALKWLTIGNGDLILGVCLSNELRVYSKRSFPEENLEKVEMPKEMHIWHLIAVCPTHPVSQDFIWGPKATPILVHEKHLSVFSQWSFKADCESFAGHCAILRRAEESFPYAACTEVVMSDENSLVKNETNEGNVHCVQTFLKLSQEPHTFDRHELHSILDIADILNGSKTIYHPKALIQYLYSGQWKRAFVVLRHLVEFVKLNCSSGTKLNIYQWGKNWLNIPENCLSEYFEDVITNISCSEGSQWGWDGTVRSTLQSQKNLFQFGDDGLAANPQGKICTGTSENSGILDLVNTLEKSSDIPYIRDIERVQTLAIVDLLGEISNEFSTSAYESLDEPGRRFWVAVRFRHLYFRRRFGRLASAEELIVDSELISWAFHSDCQDNLFSSVMSAEPSWLEMRNLGMGFWFTNATQLRARMEKLARLQYLKRKNPKDCALLYLALNRVQVLAGLFKINKDEKDRLLVGFLSRNFQEEKNKAAALKNAYVLMGRHQLELAIAFFLLGGDLSSAVTVCAKNLGDEQLALVICRLIEGYGGPLERFLISNTLLPNSIEKGDCWLSSLLEWTLGNYTQSLEDLIYSRVEPMKSETSTLGNLPGFLNPNIGQHCAILTAKNSLRNSIGDHLATVLSKLAILMAASALRRWGLPLVALECLASSSSIDGKDHEILLDLQNKKILQGILDPISSGGCNWLLGSVACHLELNAKLNLAMQYISKLLRHHPSWQNADLMSLSELIIIRKNPAHQDEHQLGNLTHDLSLAMSIFEQKYFVKLDELAKMIMVLACNKQSIFLGYRLLESYSYQGHEADHCRVDSFILDPTMSTLLLKAMKEITHFVARYVVFCNFVKTTGKACCNSRAFGMATNRHSHREDSVMLNVLHLLGTIRPLLRTWDCVILTQGLNASSASDFLTYCVYFSFFWTRRNLKELVLMIHLILYAFANDQSSLEAITGEMMKLIDKITDLIVHDASSDDKHVTPDGDCKKGQVEQKELPILSILEDEKWKLIEACLWLHICSFSENQLNKFLSVENHNGQSSMMNTRDMFPLLLAKFLLTSLACISSSLTKQLAAFFRKKASKGLPIHVFSLLEKRNRTQAMSSVQCLNQEFSTLQLTDEEEMDSLFRFLWEVSVNVKEIELFDCLQYSSQKLSVSWQDIQIRSLAENENGVSQNHKAESNNNNNTDSNESGLFLRSRFLDKDGFRETRRNDPSTHGGVSSFHNPKEVLKRSGELFESTCFNSINEQQVAVASNRKGLIFFNWKAEEPSWEQAEYIWSESDWPWYGWSSCESTPISTFVSPAAGLRGRKGAPPGLAGAAVGLGSFARPGRDLTGGGAFGIPGYAGIGASGLGWDEQEDFEQYIGPSATVENIRSRALCRHPSRPFFLVGSSTHVYLWEFGRDRAMATYGIVPAANIPQPYALASISALQFDHCGHRFASAALDGTVCTWQLEVAGRSTVQPTESSFCFDNHASDVAYVAASGSILAAAGFSTNGANIVLWDTLAPPATSQASLVCHEGGACSLSVFDSEVGSGSMPLLIVTGGTSGDVGVHDFRFIATGRSKRHRQSSSQDISSTSMNDANSGTSKQGDSANGMVWYIPKAHLGSVTSISTIPNTSLFLTGSKDGDVKLWDAKRSKLVHHWQKLHDKHTFLQPSSRGYGGVVRAALTDIQVLSHGFLTCGGDGSVKLIQLR